jgi:hypothetical protein
VRLLSTNDPVLVDRTRELLFMMGETTVEPIVEVMLNADRFLQFDFQKRDLEPAKFQKSGEFRNFMGELEDD